MTVEEYEARFTRNTATLHGQLSALHGWTRRSRWIARVIAGFVVAGLALGAGWAAVCDAPAAPSYIAPDSSILLGP
jgi:hypothetical protein